MATQLQIRRGTAAQVAAFTGAEGEIVYNSTNDSLHTNDGATAGGFELARADLNNVSDANLNAALTGNTLSALTITTLTATGGTINGTVIGGTTPAALSATTGSFSSTLGVTGAATFSSTVAGAFNGTLGATTPASVAATTLSTTGDATFSGNVAVTKTAGNTAIMSVAGNGNTEGVTDAIIGQDGGNNVMYVVNRANAAINFGTNNTFGRMTLDASGNLGLGVAPTTNNISKSISLVNGGSIFGYGSGTYITANSNYNGAWNTVATGPDSRMLLDGNVVFSRSTSATAGSAGAVSESMRIDVNGNLGLGVVPSVYNGGVTALQVKNAHLYGYSTYESGHSTNLYYDAGWKHISTQPASQYRQTIGGHQWFNAVSASAGAAATMVQAMTLDASGNLLVGTSAATGSAAASQIYGYSSSSTQGQIHFHLGSALGPCVYVKVVGSSNWSGADCAMFLARDSISTRSMNAAGTVNASGADYAEYEQNNGLTISKGSVVGFKADGTLTLTFSEAVRFAIKSTDPAYVGGDSWGTKDAIGPEPTAPDEDAEQSVIDQYEDDLTTYKAVLEAARQLVDRIAYSGKVPVNIQGATAGDYIIAVAADDGSIDGQAVSDPDFSQYKLSVGRVNRILDDGRAEVAVIIH